MSILRQTLKRVSSDEKKLVNKRRAPGYRNKEISDEFSRGKWNKCPGENTKC